MQALYIQGLVGFGGVKMFKITGHISSFQTLFGSVLRKFVLKDFVQQNLC